MTAEERERAVLELALETGQEVSVMTAANGVNLITIGGTGYAGTLGCRELEIALRFATAGARARAQYEEDQADWLAELWEDVRDEMEDEDEDDCAPRGGTWGHNFEPEDWTRAEFLGPNLRGDLDQAA